jgi:NTE family protein
MSGPRRGLVLGAGGVLGFSWAVGALTALEQEEGFDVREVDVLVGTSAGSVTAALLACGVPVEAMLRHQQGIPIPSDPVISYDDRTDSAGPYPPRPGFGLGSSRLLRETARHPRTVPPIAALSAVLPPGRASVEPIRSVIAGVLGDRSWAPHPNTWIVAMDYDSGRRVPFGRAGSPPAELPAAVAASCAIPGWFTPVVIGGRRYVDGGTRSSTSADLLADCGLDQVYVVAPMVSFAYDEPTTVAGRLERRVRRGVTRRLRREAALINAAGAEVTMLGPGPADLAAIGANLMDPTRRSRVLATSLRTSADALRRTTDPYASDDALDPGADGEDPVATLEEFTPEDPDDPGVGPGSRSAAS